MSSWSTQCIVINSSVVIALAEIGLASIMVSLTEEVIVPRAVYEEVVVRGYGRPGSRELEEFVRQGKVTLLSPRDRMLVEALHDPLGLGEAEAIALAIEYNCVVVLDDRIARSKAKSMGLKVVGAIGLLRRAYDEGLLDKSRFIQALRKLREHGFRISDEVVQKVLEKLE